MRSAVAPHVNPTAIANSDAKMIVLYPEIGLAYKFITVRKELLIGRNHDLQTHQFCIPSKFPLSYLFSPNWNIPTATATNKHVKPVIPASSGQLNRCNNCNGTNETNPAGTTVKSKSLTTPVPL